MSLTPNELLALVIVAGYLVSCIRRLKLCECLATRWEGQLSLSLSGFRLGGHKLSLLNPFTPFAPAFRSAELGHGTSGTRELPTAPVGWGTRQLLGGLCLLQLGLLVVAGPVLLLQGEEIAFAAATAASYLIALLIVLCGLTLRRTYRVTGLEYLSIAAEALLLLPWSANLLRALSSRHPIDADLFDLIALLPADERERFVVGARFQLETLLAEADAGSARHRYLSERLPPLLAATE